MILRHKKASNKITRTFFLYLFILPICFFIIIDQAHTQTRCSRQPDKLRPGENVCTKHIEKDHGRLREDITKHTSTEFTTHRDWLINAFFKEHVLPALQLFTEQMSAVAMQQSFAIGTFFDAKQQLETQRLIQTLQVDAHKDYQPSEDFCWFGTNVRSLASTEQKGEINKKILSKRQMARHLGRAGLAGATSANGAQKDKEARWLQFKEYFCDPKDNNWVEGTENTGLTSMCGTNSKKEYSNADIDYTRLIDTPRTITVDPTGNGFDLAAGGLGVSPSQKAVFALSNNLYGHDILTRKFQENTLTKDTDTYDNYMILRSLAAKRSVAENSYNSIVGLKSEGTSTSSISDSDTYKFLGTILLELGIPEAEIRNMIGTQPSYYAQLEILAKKIYQSPNFYANLYDKPANIKRKKVALKAIELMVDREIYESQMRQEMITSVLLSTRLDKPLRDASESLGGAR